MWNSNLCHSLGIMENEAKHIENDIDSDFSLHPRICIGGGDGTIAWALSIVDRALLEPEMVHRFWRRSRLLNDDSLSADESSESDDTSVNIVTALERQKLSEASKVTNEFFYSSHSEHAQHIYEAPELLHLTPQFTPHHNDNLPAITPFDKPMSNVFDYDESSLPEAVPVIQEQQTEQS